MKYFLARSSQIALAIEKAMIVLLVTRPGSIRAVGVVGALLMCSQANADLFELHSNTGSPGMSVGSGFTTVGSLSEISSTEGGANVHYDVVASGTPGHLLQGQLVVDGNVFQNDIYASVGVNGLAHIQFNNLLTGLSSGAHSATFQLKDTTGGSLFLPTAGHFNATAYNTVNGQSPAALYSNTGSPGTTVGSGFTTVGSLSGITSTEGAANVHYDVVASGTPGHLLQGQLVIDGNVIQNDIYASVGTNGLAYIQFNNLLTGLSPGAHSAAFQLKDATGGSFILPTAGHFNATAYNTVDGQSPVTLSSYTGLGGMIFGGGFATVGSLGGISSTAGGANMHYDVIATGAVGHLLQGQLMIDGSVFQNDIYATVGTDGRAFFQFNNVVTGLTPGVHSATFQLRDTVGSSFSLATQGHFNAVGYNTHAVPEPSSLLLLGAGTCGSIICRSLRRSKRRAVTG